MMEDIVSFIQEAMEEPTFFIEMAGISYCDGTYHIARKNSSCYVFEYVIDGEGMVITDGKSFTAKKGDVYILHRQSNHEYYSDQTNPWTKIWINAKGSLIDGLIQIYKLNNMNHFTDTDVGSFFQSILNIAKENQENKTVLLEKASLVFFELLLNLHKNVNKDVNLLYSTEAMILKKYLDRNNRNNVTLQELSQHIYHSPSQTIRIFKQSFGVTPYQYLMNQKLEIAKLLIMNTNKSIKEISIELSFRDEHYFSNYFKKKIGISPHNYRKIAKE